MKKLFLTLFFVMFSANSFAADVTIEMLNKNKETKKRMVYSQELVKIDVGQSIEWVPTAKGHNVEFRAGPKGFKAPKKSKIGKEYSYTFDIPGVYAYWCTPHKSMGMIGLVVVGENLDNVENIAKTRMFGRSKKKYICYS